MSTDRIRVFIDNCMWNRIHEQNLNLRAELPSERFEILLNKHVHDFEIESIPEVKNDLRSFIQRQIEECEIGIESYFGFVSINDPEDYKPRVDGFGKGKWITYREARFAEHFKYKAKVQGSGLFYDEADASLAVQACTGSVVLTDEKMDKKGPLKDAYEIGGKVAYFRRCKAEGISISELVVEASSRQLIGEYSAW